MAPNSRKSRKVRVMGASGQTDAERRALRTKQRSLQRDIQNSEVGDAMENPDSEAFQEVRGMNNDLFQKVHYTREGVLDGENLDLISSRAARQVDKLVQVPRYDAARFARKLREKCSGTGSSRFDWNRLGKEVGTCFHAVPSGVTILCGPVDSVYAPKERKQRARRSKNDDEEEEVEEERPEEVKQLEKDADKLSAVEKHIRVIRKTLRKRCAKEGAKRLAKLNEIDESEMNERQKRRKRDIEETGQSEISVIQYLFNPNSFTQTVENMFHFSFLVKQGQASMRVDEDGVAGGGPVVSVADMQDEASTPRQAIVALNMEDWRNLVAAYSVKESYVPHRVGSKFERERAADAAKGSPGAD